MCPHNILCWMPLSHEDRTPLVIHFHCLTSYLTCHFTYLSTSWSCFCSVHHSRPWSSTFLGNFIMIVHHKIVWKSKSHLLVHSVCLSAHLHHTSLGHGYGRRRRIGFYIEKDKFYYNLRLLTNKKSKEQVNFYQTLSSRYWVSMAQNDLWIVSQALQAFSRFLSWVAESFFYHGPGQHRQDEVFLALKYNLITKYNLSLLSLLRELIENTK